MIVSLGAPGVPPGVRARVVSFPSAAGAEATPRATPSITKHNTRKRITASTSLQTEPRHEPFHYNRVGFGTQDGFFNIFVIYYVQSSDHGTFLPEVVA